MNDFVSWGAKIIFEVWRRGFFPLIWWREWEGIWLDFWKGREWSFEGEIWEKICGQFWWKFKLDFRSNLKQISTKIWLKHNFKNSKKNSSKNFNFPLKFLNSCAKIPHQTIFLFPDHQPRFQMSIQHPNIHHTVKEWNPQTEKN